jgi:hypothetical protein
MALTLQSPGVQIREVDLSLAAPGIPPTTVLIPGFAAKGPTSEPVTVSTISEWEQIYGLPTNAAERYFYQTAAAVFNSPANVVAYRLPYGTGAGIDTSNQYSALVYPAVAVMNQTGPLSALSAAFINAYGYTAAFAALTGSPAAATTTITVPVSTTSFDNVSGSGAYFLGQPSHMRLTQTQYLNILNGTAFSWSSTGGQASFNSLSDLPGAAVIILNKSQNAINTRFEGNYIGLIDNTNLYPSTPFDDVSNVYSVNSFNNYGPNSYIQIPQARINFPLSASSLAGPNGSISQVLETIPSFDISTSSFNDTVALGLIKLRQSIFAPNTIALDYIVVESYTGSLDSHRQINNPRGGQPLSYFLGDVESDSTNIQVLVNTFISQKNSTTWLNTAGLPSKAVRLLSNPRKAPISNDVVYYTNVGLVSTDTYLTRMGCTSAQYAALVGAYGSTDALFPLGDYSTQDLTVKTIGSVPSKVSTMLNYMQDPALWPLSLVCEAGLGTIFANTNGFASVPSLSGLPQASIFDDTVPYPVNSTTRYYDLTAQNPVTPAQIVTDYNAVAQLFVNFASLQRKDHVFIADPLTNIFVQNGVKTLTNPNNNFSLNLYWPLRNQFASFNNSYTTIYGNVVEVFDNASNQAVWVPFSGFAAQAMANTDSNYQPWFAPAGFTRGIISGILDIGYSPVQKERDQLYTISINPVAQFPNEGYVIYGQKTAFKQPSAFDRINVRRLFLVLESQVKTVAEYFVFEPNTLFTRTRLVNTITPIFDNAKDTQGLYDYLIVCDERNNTPYVIDQNELVVDIYIKPVRTAEFILVNFYATQTSTNFSEIVA